MAKFSKRKIKETDEFDILIHGIQKIGYPVLLNNELEWQMAFTKIKFISEFFTEEDGITYKDD